MGVMEGFTRQETLALTETTSNRLQHLDRSGLVVPERYGNSKKPTVIYTWEQVLEIRAIKNLRQEVSLQTVRKIINLLDNSGFDNSLRDKKIVVLNDEVYWVMPDWSDMPRVMKVADKSDRELGQYMLIVIPPLASVVEEVWEAARQSKVIDFESFRLRAKAQPARSA
ncbi:helix-turn-helix domain-containing protein [Leptolyngbya sp. PL-A3]|uniref:MerR family transcriptional regulator n=1 Tax=Leptolyngbya sp. PL-A3 TaxID=2933911 RepID=UPI00329976B4